MTLTFLFIAHCAVLLSSRVSLRTTGEKSSSIFFEGFFARKKPDEAGPFRHIGPALLGVALVGGEALLGEGSQQLLPSKTSPLFGSGRL